MCDAEYDSVPEDRKRLKFKRDGSTDKQVRTNPADVANTILKMADKRAFVAMTLLATAASDCFSQDLEDLPPEIAEGLEGREPAHEPIKPAQPKGPPPEVEFLSFIPADVEVKTGEKDGKTWTKFGVKHHDGKFYGTFDENFGQLATDSMRDKLKITVGFKYDKTGKYRNIVSMTPTA